MNNILPELSNEKFVEFCFVFYLRRPVDEEGKQHFLKILDNGVHRLEIIKGIISGQEYLTLLNQSQIPSEKNSGQTWVPYKVEQVVDTDVAKVSVRNYLEQKDLREILNRVDKKAKIKKAVEFGCGFGRMTQVLTEFTKVVTGLEREKYYVEEANMHIPTAVFRQIDDLSKVPFDDKCVDLIMTFTFLQHLIDDQARKVAGEMIRCLGKNGHILICEETDEDHVAGDIHNPLGQCAIGRSVKRYSDIFKPLDLEYTKPRRVEPGYPRKETGTYMLFHKK